MENKRDKILITEIQFGDGQTVMLVPPPVIRRGDRIFCGENELLLRIDPPDETDTAENSEWKP